MSRTGVMDEERRVSKRCAYTGEVVETIEHIAPGVKLIGRHRLNGSSWDIEQEGMPWEIMERTRR